MIEKRSSARAERRRPGRARRGRRRSRSRQSQRLSHVAALDAHDGRSERRDVHPDRRRRRDAAGQAPVRVDPGRYRAPDARRRAGRRLCQPRDVDRPVPVQRPRHATEANSQNDFDERPAESPRAEPAQRPACSPRRKVIASELELPALLLELPRHGERGLRPWTPLHERGGNRLRQPDRKRVAGADRRTATAAQAGVVVAYDIEDRGAQAGLRDGPAQPREQRCDPGLRRARRPLGRRHVHAEPGAVPALLVHRALTRTRSGTTPAGSTASGSTIRASTTTTTSRSARPPRIPARSSRSPRPQPRARRPGWRLRPTQPESSTSSASRTSPTTSGRGWGTRLRRRLGTGLGRRGPGNASHPRNGRIWKLDPRIPTIRRTRRLSLFVEGDDSPVKTPGEIHQPDNLETTAAEPARHRGSRLEPAVRRSARPTAQLRRPPGSGVCQPRNGRADRRREGRPGGRRGPTDVDAAAAGNLGAWESSGVVDASEVVRPRRVPRHDAGAHALAGEGDRGAGDNAGAAGPGFTNKRAGGQLVLASGSRRLAGRARAGQATRPGSPSSSRRTTNPGPPAKRQWSMFSTRPSRETSGSVTVVGSTWSAEAIGVWPCTMREPP